MNANKLRNEIIDLRDKLDNISKQDPGWYWSYNRRPHFPDKRNYPIDFQMFMEEIGETHVKVGSERGGGYRHFHLELPRDLQNCRQDFEEGKTDLIILPNVFSEDDENDGQNVDNFCLGYETRFMKMFANPSDNTPYCFITETIPYQFWSPYYFSYTSFWECFKGHMQELAE